MHLAAKKQHVDELVTRTRHWLEKKQTDQQQELAFQLLGLQWCGSSTSHKAKSCSQEFRSMQNEDGGWSQLPTMKSDAYATGQTLYALYESGMERSLNDATCTRMGLNYLLKTAGRTGRMVCSHQVIPDTAVCTIATFRLMTITSLYLPAATNWAVMALLNALPEKKY